MCLFKNVLFKMYARECIITSKQKYSLSQGFPKWANRPPGDDFCKLGGENL